MSRTPLLDRMGVPVKVALVLLALYFFLVGIGAMGASFKMMGDPGELLGSLGKGEGLLGAIVSLFIGILATTIVQSSSSTTALVVSLVAAGAVSFHSAVYMVMGANVGTTVTNTIVSLGHITRSNEYRRAFAAATVHDFFNLLVLLILFPLEVATRHYWGTGLLELLAIGATDAFKGMGGLKAASPIKVITLPTIDALKAVITAVGLGGKTLFFVALFLLFAGLISLVKLLRSIMVTKLENLFDRVIFKSALRGVFFGFLLTILVQSSSITTSLVIPLVGAGILSIRQVLPYTMGSNIGTTVTALLAALAAYAAADPDSIPALLAVRLAFLHVSFNIIGVLLIWEVRWLPIRIAEWFAQLAMWNRFIPIAYIVLTFYVIPFLVIWFGR